MSVKWKPKMKLKCPECGVVSKMIVNKVHNCPDDMVFRTKCKLCGDESMHDGEYFETLIEGAKS